MTGETSSALVDAYKELRDSFGVSISFGASTITAIVEKSRLAKELVIGGYPDSGDISAKILTSDLSAVPEIGDSATYKGRSFKVSTISLEPGSLIAELDLRPANR